MEQAQREQLGAFNPNRGDLEDLGLSFDRLRGAVRILKEGATETIDQPAKDLNNLRNRIAHQIDCNLVGGDLRRLAEWVGSFTDANPSELATYPARCTELAAASIVLFLTAGRVAHRQLQSLQEQQRALDAAFAESANALFDRVD